MPYGSDPTTPPATPRWNDYPLVKDDDLPPLVPLTQADAAARSMGWEVVSQMPVSRWQNAPLADKTPVVSVPKGEAKNLSDAKPGGIYVTVPAGTHQGTAPASGTELPPEADLLYNKVRRAEGTADNPWKVYGGDPFAPGREHPGEAARRVDPKTGKVTHAAGPGQWEPDTWNGLKPDFQARFGRNPDFSSDDDQRAMTWLNASKVYPGGRGPAPRGSKIRQTEHRIARVPVDGIRRERLRRALERHWRGQVAGIDRRAPAWDLDTGCCRAMARPARLPRHVATAGGRRGQPGKADLVAAQRQCG
jgi:hypothetical protein